MATRKTIPKKKTAAKKTGAKSTKAAGRKSARRPANEGRKPKREQRKKSGGRREAPIPRKAGAKAAKSRAKKAGVKPGGGEGKSAATGRMHRTGRRVKELAAPKSRPAGLTRQQRKKATNEEGFGFKQIEERLDTTLEKSGIVAERRKAVTDYEDEVKVGGVEQAGAGYVDYDKQERTGDAQPDEEPQVDIEAPAAVEEE